jgi:hypothetical protein
MEINGMSIEEFADGVVKYFLERDRKNKEFFESEEFNGLMKIIQRTPIDEESLRYKTQEVEGLDSEKYIKVCEAIFHRYERKMVQDPECPFLKSSIDYEGVRFHLMLGQGAAYWSEPLKK